MKVLVTGGAGYIGSHVVNLLGKRGDTVVTVDNLVSGYKEAVLYGEFVEQDIADHAKLEKIMEGGDITACLHFAGSLIVPESVTNPYKYYHNNTINSLNLINSCIKHGIDKFIFSSTSTVYGTPSGDYCTESDPTHPINPYGRSKLMTEWCLEDMAKISSLRFVILRYFNVAGASVDGLLGQRGENCTHLIKVCLQSALDKKEMEIFGTNYPTPDGTCIRDYIHVEDLAQAHLSTLDYLMEGGKSNIFNCGYGKGYSVSEVVGEAKRVTGINFVAKEALPRAGDAAKVVSSNKKIIRETNWRPRHNDLEFIIKTAWNWEQKLKR